MADVIQLKEIGDKIRAARNARKISLSKLSRLSKINMTNIWLIEKGRCNPRVLTLIDLAKALNLDVKDFL